MTQANWLRQLLLLLILCACAGAAEQIRCALIVDRNEELRSSALASLLEARLSQDGRLQLLERDQIDAILREQRVSLTTAAEPNAAVKVGRLLRADVFVLLSIESSDAEGLSGNPPNRGGRPVENLRLGHSGMENSDGVSMSDSQPQAVGQLLRVRVVETAHGLRLWDRYEQLDKSDVQATADRIAERVRSVMQRIGRPLGQVIPVGIVDVHRVQLPERYERLARVLPGLLSARLSAEPRILMLERESLGTLLKEKQLTDGNDSVFWNSAVLIDGYIQPDPNAQIQISLRLRRSDGTGLNSFTAPVDPNAPVPALDQATARIAQAILSAPPSASWDPVKEAREFYRQGELLAAHRRQVAATMLLETARALQPGNVQYTGALFEAIWQGRTFQEKPATNSWVTVFVYPDLQVAELAATLVRQIQRGYDEGSLAAGDLCGRQGTPLWFLSDNDGYFYSSASVSSDDVRSMNRTTRRAWAETYDRVLRKEKFDAHPSLIHAARVQVAWAWSDEPDRLVQHMEPIMNEVIMPLELGGIVQPPAYRQYVCKLVLPCPRSLSSAFVLSDSHLCGSEKRFVALWNGYLDKLSSCVDPVVRFHANMVRARHAFETVEPDSGRNSVKDWQNVIDVLVNELLVSSSPLSEATKHGLCSDVKRELNQYCRSDAATLVGLHKKVCETLIQRKDILALAAWDPGATVPLNSGSVSLELAREYYDLLEGAGNILRTAGVVGSDAALRRIRDCQARIRQSYPQMNVTLEPSHLAAAMLVRQRDWPDPVPAGGGQTQWRLRGDKLCVLTANRNAPLRLSIVDLRDRKATALWQTRFQIQTEFLFGLAVGDGASYASVNGIGLIVLPGTMSHDRGVLADTEVLTQQHGLPSLAITGLAGGEDRLWVAYGRLGEESGLGCYDPKARRWETVFCSAIAGPSKLSNGEPYILYQLAEFAPNRLFFVMGRTRSPTMLPYVGLWCMDIATRRAEYRGECDLNESQYGEVETYRGMCWCKSPYSLVRIDPNSGRASYMIGRSWRPSDRNREKVVPSLKCDNDLFIPEASLGHITFGPHDRGSFDLATSTIHGNQLWARLGESQIAVLKQGRPFEETRIIPNDILEGEPAERFISTPYGLVAIGNGMVGLIQADDGTDTPQSSGMQKPAGDVELRR